MVPDLQTTLRFGAFRETPLDPLDPSPESLALAPSEQQYPCADDALAFDLPPQSTSPCHISCRFSSPRVHAGLWIDLVTVCCCSGRRVLAALEPQLLARQGRHGGETDLSRLSRQAEPRSIAFPAPVNTTVNAAPRESDEVAGQAKPSCSASTLLRRVPLSGGLG